MEEGTWGQKTVFVARVWPERYTVVSSASSVFVGRMKRIVRFAPMSARAVNEARTTTSTEPEQPCASPHLVVVVPHSRRVLGDHSHTQVQVDYDQGCLPSKCCCANIAGWGGQRRNEQNRSKGRVHLPCGVPA